jgi:hypothetical protein
MSLAKCTVRLAEAFNVSQEKAHSIVQSVEGIKSNHTDPAQFKKAVEDFITSEGYKLTKKAKQEVYSLVKTIEGMDRITSPGFFGDAKQAILSMIEGSTSAVKGSARSIEHLTGTFRSKYIHGTQHALAQAGLLPAFTSDNYSRQIVKALFNGEKDTSADAAVINGIADIFRNTLDNIWADSTASGMNIGHIKNYVPATHNKEDIVTAGFNQWAKDVMVRIDNQKTFPHLNRQTFIEAVDGFKAGKSAEDLADKNEWVKELKKDYDRFSRQFGRDQLSDFSSVLDSLPEDTVTGMKVTAAERSRSYHWKNGDMFIEYNDLYGRNKTFSEMMGGYTNKMVRELATVEMLGATPHETLNNIIESADKAGYFAKTSLEAAKADIKTSFDMATGTFYREINKNNIHAVGKQTRQVLGFSQLGMSAISNLMDLPTMILNNWSRGGDNVASAIMKGVYDYVDSVSDVITKEARADAALSMAEAILEESNMYLLGNDTLRKDTNIGKALNSYLTWTGMKFANRVSTVGNFKTVMRAIDKGVLSEVTLTDLSRFNISKEMIEHVRPLLRKYDYNLNTLLFSDDAAVKKAMTDNPLKLNELEYRNELNNRLTGYIREYITSGSPRPGITEARKLAFNTKPGTVYHEAALTMTQYKGINLKQIRNMILASRLRGSTTTETAKVLAAHAGVGIAFSGAVMAIRHYIQNGYDAQKTEDYIIENPAAFFGKSLARSNAAAFIGEMFIDRNGNMVNDMAEFSTQAMGAPSAMVIGNAVFKGVDFAKEVGKEAFPDGTFKGGTDVHKKYESFITAVSRGAPLRNHPVRYIPVIEEGINESFQMLLDLGK